jgi:hypothetical protein
MIEVIKEIIGYEGLYKIGDKGTVLSLDRVIVDKNGFNKTIHGRTLSHRKHPCGYRYVSLCKDGKTNNFLIHRLIAINFLPNEDNKKCINHINGNKIDNRLENIEWCSHSENNFHASRLGLCNRKGSNNGKAKLTNEQAIFIKSNYIRKHPIYNSNYFSFNIGFDCFGF